MSLIYFTGRKIVMFSLLDLGDICNQLIFCSPSLLLILCSVVRKGKAERGSPLLLDFGCLQCKY